MNTSQQPCNASPMAALLILILVMAATLGCREYDRCEDPDFPCPDEESAFSCSDACDKLFLVCGFTGFGNDIGACRKTCLAEPAETRNLTCFRDETCVAISQGECIVEAGSDDPYQAYVGAGGPYCGKDNSDSHVYCMPGDNCLEEVTNRCTPPPGDGRYQAYVGSGGPYCGRDNRDTNVYCVPGDNCISEIANTCQ